MGLLPFLPGAIFSLVSVVMLMFPPQQPNMWYGYRTRRSMRSQEAWDDANDFSAWALLIAGLLAMNLALSCRVLHIDPAYTMLIVAAAIVVLLAVVIGITERRLRIRWEDQEGEDIG